MPDGSGNRSRLGEQYRAALAAFLVEGEGEHALFRAYELGRQAIASKLSVVDLVAIHHEAIFALLAHSRLDKRARPLFDQGQKFLNKSLAQVEMIARGFADTNDELRAAEARYRELNSELERRLAQRTLDLEAANKELESFS
jgi:hypothetical protein